MKRRGLKKGKFMLLAKWLFGLVICFGGLLLLPGCSGNRMPAEFGPPFPVQGKVTLGGKPLRGGIVRFFPLDHDGRKLNPRGVINSEGNYTVSSYGKKGAPAGKYRVTVDPGSDDKSMDLAVDAKYQNWQHSPLIVTVMQDAPAGAYDLNMEMREP